MNFTAPIPGMSLTREPGNSPWEQPPLYSKPEEALAFYFNKLSDEDTLDDTLFLLEQKYPLEAFVDSLTSYGVMEGYHTFDVKVLVSPVIHEHLLSLCETLDIKIVEEVGPSKEEKMKRKERKRVSLLFQQVFDAEGEIEPLEEVAPVEEEEVAPEMPTPSEPSIIPRRV